MTLLKQKSLAVESRIGSIFVELDHAALSSQNEQRIEVSFVRRVIYNFYRRLFYHGNSNRSLVSKQMRVFRGQVWNLLQSLQAGESPSDLVRRPPLVVAQKHGSTQPTNLNWAEWYRVKHVGKSYSCCF